MPRRAKTNSGHPAQVAPEIPGQYYGAHVEQQKLADAQPMPDRRATVSGPSTPSSPQAAPSPGPSTFAQALEQAGALRGRAGLLRNPTARPDEPVTAGLRSGPGPGPEVMSTRQGTRQSRFLHDLSVATGDPQFADIARRLGL